MSTTIKYTRSIRIGGGYVTLTLADYDPLTASASDRNFIDRLVARFDERARPDTTSKEGRDA